MDTAFSRLNLLSPIYIGASTISTNIGTTPKIIKYPVYWNWYYAADEWEKNYSGFPRIRYQNFNKYEKNLLGKYIESFTEKYENDGDFNLYFKKYIWRFFPSVHVDRLKSVVDDCEYLFQEYNNSLPEQEKLKDGKKTKDKRGVVIWRNQPVEKWRQIRLLAKPLIGCIFDNDQKCVDFGKEITEYRNAKGVTHFDGQDVDFSNLENLSRKLTVVAKFHFLNLIYEDSNFNCALIEECKYGWLGPDTAN